MALHVAGAGWTARVLGLSGPGLGLLESLVAIPLVLAALLKRKFLPACLAPFFLLYPFILVRYLSQDLLRHSIPRYLDAAPVSLDVLLLFLPALVGAAVIQASLIAVLTNLSITASRKWALALFAVGLVWTGGEFLLHRTSGTTGSDPYVYVQMAIDLARTGTVLHRFDLFPRIVQLGVAWYPVVHIGYHLPGGEGWAPSVWPYGGSLLYALVFKLVGEGGLYWVNPLVTITASLATIAFARLLLVREPRGVMLATALLSGMLLLTSHEQALWARVTMVDAQAEVATVLSFMAALTWHRTVPSLRSGLLGALGCGLALGFAYLVRHTQLLLVPAILVLGLTAPLARGSRFYCLVLTGVTALAVALPDLWYHQVEFGSWLRPESEELALFALAVVPESANSLWDSATRGFEFGWLVPLVLWGAVSYSRRAPRLFLAICLWEMGLVFFHLPYAAVRLRDLLPEFPPLAFFAAYGATELFYRLERAQLGWRVLVPASFAFIVLDLLVLRVWFAWERPLQPTLGAFGYLTAGQRQAIEAIGLLVPPGGVIGAGFNDGALDLYTGRETARPQDWTAAERQLVTCDLQRTGRSMALLVDTPGVQEVAQAFSAGGADLHAVRHFDVQTYDPAGNGIRDPGALVLVAARCPP